MGRVALCYSVSFVSFSLRLYRQRKAAKDFCYQDLLDAFFFGIRATKKKALQKRNGVFCAHAARAPPLKRWTKRSAKRVRTFRQIPIYQYIIFPKTQIYTKGDPYAN